ncbi:MAG: hypothetical protein HC779_07705 [Phyllobacteriaceae bacterium]|nr:hypothetical protein [Phyllobacteriaceae bacterium]
MKKFTTSLTAAVVSAAALATTVATPALAKIGLPMMVKDMAVARPMRK